MGGAILLSILVHAVALVAFVEVSRERQEALVAPAAQPEQPAIEVEILADPRAGAPDADGTTEVDQAATPPAQQTDQQTAQETAQETATQPEPAAADPEPAAQTPPPELAEPDQAQSPPVPEPTPTPPQPNPEPPRALPPRPAATPPAPRLPPARVRAGGGTAGQNNGTTDIILGDNTVPAGPDPSQYNIPPHYPRDAVQRGQQGTVRLSVVVATDGTALSVDVAGSSGYPILDRAARNAVAKWRFRPGRDGGLAVPSTIPVTLNFVLDERR